MKIKPVNSIRYQGVGQLHLIPNSNLGICHFKGSPYEVGQQYGARFGADLSQFQGFLKGMLSEAVGSFLSKLIYYAVLPIYSLIQWFRIKPSLRQEIKGMADGSSLSTFEMVRLSSLYDFMVNVALAGEGCSSFVKKDAEGNLLIGRNFDTGYNPLGTFDHSQIILYEIEGQRPFISVGPIFFNAAPTTAILRDENGEPLFFAIHNVLGPRSFFGKPTVSLLRELAALPTFEDMERSLKISKRTCSKIILFADRSQAAAAEIAGGKTSSIRKIEGDSLVVTNDYVTRRAKKHLRELAEIFIHGLAFNPRVRRHALAEALKGKICSVDVAIFVLSNQYDYTRGETHPWGEIISPPYSNDQRKPRVGNINRTYYSTILDYLKGELWVAAGEFAPQGDFYGFNLSQLWEWTQGREDLQFEMLHQFPDLIALKQGCELTKKLCQGKDEYEKENFSGAIRCLQDILETDSEQVEVHLLLGAICLERLDFVSAEKYLLQVLAIEEKGKVLPEFRKGSAFACLLLGIIYDLCGRKDEALARYKQALSFKAENEFGAEAAEKALKYLSRPFDRSDLASFHKELVTLLL